MTNREFTKDKFFRKCCEFANVLPTTRQASKYRRDKGSAFEMSSHIRMKIKQESKKVNEKRN